MELLNDFNPADPISQVLRAVRIRSTVWCRSLLGAPWGYGVRADGNPAFHLVTSGRCWLEVDGEPGQLALRAGDLVVLPTGRRHWMRDDPDTPATELEEILASTPPDEHRRLRHGGRGARTELLCGGFALEGGSAHPILRALPTAVYIRGAAGRPVPWLAATLALITAETASDAPGAEEVVGRLADALLTQALRAALAELESSNGTSVLALRDPQIAAAIELIHRQPERAWTVGDVAAKVALSRSAFSARFRDLVGESPSRYITRTRLATPQPCCTRPTHRWLKSPREPATAPSSPSARPSSARSASRRAPTADSQTRFPGSAGLRRRPPWPRKTGSRSAGNPACPAHIPARLRYMRPWFEALPAST